MKKIILGCAAVLLSIGLLAGCNNEESDKAVSIKVDTAATVVVGESLSLPYTVEPEKADIEVLNNHEEYVTAVAQEGTLYLEGVAEGSATVTLVGTYKKYTEANVSIAVSVVTEATADTGPEEEEPGDTGDTEPGEQVITLSVDATLDLIESGEPATIVPDVTPAEADIEYEIKDVEFVDNDPEPDDDDYVISVTPTEEGYVVTPGAQGTANIVFTASLVGYDAVSATTAVTVHESGWEPEEPDPFESYTVKVVLTTSDRSAFPDPETDYAVWVASDYDSASNNTTWGEAHAMTYEGEGVFTYKYDGAPTWTSDTYSGGVYAGTAEAISWSHEFNAISIPNPTSESGDVVGEFSIQSSIGDTWADIFPQHVGSSDVYVVIFEDQNNLSGDSVLTTNIVKVAGGRNSDAEGYPTPFFSGSNESDVASSTNSTGSTDQPYVYNTTAATVEAEYKSDAWFTAYDGGSWNHKVECSKLGTPMGEIPDVEEGYIAVFSAVYNSAEEWSWTATTGISNLSGGWCLTATSIDNFFSTCVTGTVN